MSETRLTLNMAFHGSGDYLGNFLVVSARDPYYDVPPQNLFEEFFIEDFSDGYFDQTFNLPPGTTHLRMIVNMQWQGEDLLPDAFHEPGPGEESQGIANGTIQIQVNDVDIFNESHVSDTTSSAVRYQDFEIIVPVTSPCLLRFFVRGNTSLHNARYNHQFGFFQYARRIVLAYITDLYAVITPVEQLQCDCCCCSEG